MLAVINFSFYTKINASSRETYLREPSKRILMMPMMELHFWSFIWICLILILPIFFLPSLFFKKTPPPRQIHGRGAGRRNLRKENLNACLTYLAE